MAIFPLLSHAGFVFSLQARTTKRILASISIQDLHLNDNMDVCDGFISGPCHKEISLLRADTNEVHNVIKKVITHRQGAWTALHREMPVMNGQVATKLETRQNWGEKTERGQQSLPTVICGR